jgi:lipopolysaccharide export system protein LptA
VIIKANQVERNVKTDVVVATGNVSYFSKKVNLLCDKVTIYRKEKRAVLEGNVSMLIKPEDQEKLEEVALAPLRPIVPEEIANSRPAPPTEKSDQEKQLDDEVRSNQNRRKYPVQVLAAKIEYWYGEGSRRADITGAPQARQELPAGRWRQVWAYKAHYDGEKETLRLDSSPGHKETRIMTSLGDDIHANWFEVSTKEEDDAWSAEALDGIFVPDDNEIPKEPGSDKKKGTGGGGGVTAPSLQGKIGG